MDRAEEISLAINTHLRNMANNPYVYASVAIIAVISISLLSAIMVLPLLNKSFSKHILSMLTMLAVGCLCGDAIFHLIPHSLGIDSKQVIYLNTTFKEGSMKSMANESKDVAVVLKCTLVVASIYMFYLLNNVMNFCQIGHSHSHGHSHTIPHVSLPIDNHSSNSCTLERRQRKPAHEHVVVYDKDNENTKLLENEPQDNIKLPNGSELNFKSHFRQSSDEFSFRKVPRVVWMILIGGLMHNVTDGLAVGASFAGSFPGGISTTLAILFHEIPHAIGDFVVLLSNGLRVKTAMTFIASTYTASFAGCYTGVALGKELNIVDWIFAVTAGMFLYIALVELLPDTIDDADENGPRQLSTFLAQNLGFVIGTGTMALIAAYEDDIKNALRSY